MCQKGPFRGLGGRNSRVRAPPGTHLLQALMTFWMRENVYGDVFRHVRAFLLYFNGFFIRFSEKKTIFENFLKCFY